MKKYLLAKIREESIGFDINNIVEINEIKNIRKIPLTPAFIMGIIILRDEIIPIIDLEKMFYQSLNNNKKYQNQNSERTNNNSNSNSTNSIVGRNSWGYTRGSFNSNKQNKDDDKFKIIIIEIDLKYKIGVIVEELGDILNDFNENIPDIVSTDIPLSIIDNIYAIDDESHIHHHSGDSIFIVLDLNKVYEEALTQLKEFNANRKSTAKGANIPIIQDKDFIANKKLKLIKDQQMSLNKEDFTLEQYLDPNAIDSIKELINIASGNASKAIADFFNIKSIINMDVPKADFQRLEDISQLFKDPEEKFISIKSNIMSDKLNATNLILISIKDFFKFLDTLNKTNALDLKIPNIKKFQNFKFNEELSSLAQEFGNIIIGNYVSAISNFLNIKINNEVPQFTYDMIGSVLNSLTTQGDKYTTSIITFLTKMHVQKSEIGMIYLFIPWWNTIDSTIDLLNNLIQPPLKSLDLEDSLDINQKILNNKSPKTKSKERVVKENKNLKEQEEHIFDFDFKEDNIANNLDLLDMLREIGNIGAGNAGTALSQMINKKVMLEIPEARYMTLSNFKRLFSNIINGKIVAIISYIGDNFNTDILLFFTLNDIKKILTYLLEPSSSKKKSSIKNEHSNSPKNKLSSKDQDIIIEVYNILMGHYISALSNFLRISLPPPQHRFFTGKINNLFTKIESIKDEVDDNKNIAVIETRLLISNINKVENIVGYFVFIPNSKTLSKIIQQIEKF
ncbi:MAG: chemotaxis protein CheC [Promethearchaeota archaeon]